MFNTPLSASSIVSFVGKALATVVALVASLALLQFVWVRFAIQRAETRGEVCDYVLGDFETSKQVAEVQRLWPTFPGWREEDLSEMALNDVPMITEVAESTASAAEILDYYREQMGARGWYDVTESHYGLSPERQNMGAGGPGIGSERYASLYHDTIESKLVLSRGPWSMQIAVEPGSASWLRRVRIVAVQSPSLKDFSSATVEKMGSTDGNDDESGGMKASEVIDGERYETSIRTSNEEPIESFASTLSELEAEGWGIIMSAGAPGDISGYFALLQKGTDFAYLVVSEGAEGKGSSESLTRITAQ